MSRLSTNTPHLDPEWVEQFVVQLRLRDVPGARIGAHLAELEAHCADSGQRVSEAFGDPESYAREVAAVPHASMRTPVDRVREHLGVLLGLVGLILVPLGVGVWRSEGGVEVSWGALVSAAIVIAAGCALVLGVDRLLPWIVRHPWWSALIGMSLVPLTVAVLLALPQPAFAPAAGPLLAIGVVSLLAGLIWDLTHPQPSDPIQGPRQLGGVGSIPVGRTVRVLSALTPYLFVILTVIASVASWILPAGR